MKPVSASARLRIIKRNLQIVLAQKPAEDALGFIKPIALAGKPVDLQAGRNGCASLDRLLIEAGLLCALGKASAGTDRHKDVFVAAVLCGHKPFKSFDPCRDHPFVVTAPSGEDERLWQPCIRVRKTLLEPTPGLGVTAFVNVQQAIGERVANALNRPVAGEPVQ